MMTEVGGSSNTQPGAKYFSQRIQNQIHRAGPGDGTQGARTSKEELLRAYIKPSDKEISSAEESKVQQRQASINSSNTQDLQAQPESTKLKQRLAQRQTNKVTSALNELGGFNGASLEKI